MTDERYLAFPFRLTPAGGTASTDLDGAIRGRIEQLLFTAPGERVMLPAFGCGARDLVFQGNNEVLAAATEFTIAKALQAFLGHLVMVHGVHVQHEEETLRVEVVYTRSRDLERERVVYQLLPQEGANRG
ncbi:GPW/gp25 family protein [Ramlibacter monticola]|uniref:GPW/gp25 family protein n=1 Tax=Ramlibacter monticola TaxID=1926872 RepID=A0A936Z2H3_9BURK|nr:GPW/gp25 family protein [Ramlibacter monticola]MBL0392347.1 GPW/gp25 family protein [Ramlibacter monticola]